MKGTQSGLSDKLYRPICQTGLSDDDQRGFPDHGGRLRTPYYIAKTQVEGLDHGLIPTQIPRHSRVYGAITASRRNRRPSNNASETKSCPRRGLDRIPVVVDAVQICYGEHGLVETLISNQLLQAKIFLFQLPHVFQFSRRSSAVLFAPDIKRGVGDAQPAADLWHGHAQFSLLQGKDYPLFGES